MEKINQILSGKAHKHIYYSAHIKDNRLLLIFPTWAGITDFELETAAKLSANGINVCVVDLFGEEVDLGNVVQRQAAMVAILSDMNSFVVLLQQLSQYIVDKSPLKQPRLMTSGYCLGGLCSMTCAFLLPEIEAAASFHGLMKVPVDQPPLSANVRLLIMNGHRDPMVSPQELKEFTDRLTNMNIDWTLMNFGNAAHSFALPSANNLEQGIYYEPKSARRAYSALQQFISETAGITE